MGILNVVKRRRRERRVRESEGKGEERDVRGEVRGKKNRR